MSLILQNLSKLGPQLKSLYMVMSRFKINNPEENKQGGVVPGIKSLFLQIRCFSLVRKSDGLSPISNRAEGKKIEKDKSKDRRNLGLERAWHCCPQWERGHLISFVRNSLLARREYRLFIPIVKLKMLSSVCIWLWSNKSCLAYRHFYYQEA
ncbi:hypothetical protein KUTeg_011050 [Tegillarca granosa]|uniref:Uncharacterized protein n=1 Tax=Tegillarca granosa TaxID=220873 RepID=A0ABQ9F608_TEGGR|nr:hypothetical protein KUTeg_011050 [Tegillarca granosa]